MQRTSVWRSALNRPARPVLKDSKTCEVAVIGAGITGLTAATLLTKAGMRVAVVEAKTVGAGTSGYTSGHLSTFWDGQYRKIIEGHGLESAKRLYGLLNHGKNLIGELSQELNIDCDYEEVAGVLYAENGQPVNDVRGEMAAFKAMDFDIEKVDVDDLPISAVAAIEHRNQARFHVGKYLVGISRLS